MKADLRGRVGLVTGAGSGIGAALVQELVARGASVAALDIDGESLARVSQDTGAAAWPCDVTDEEAVERVAREVSSTLGAPSLVFANAGVATAGPVQEVPIRDARWVLEVNVIGTMIVTRAFLPAMIDAGAGAVVFTASIAGLVGVPGMSAYSASKFAVVGFAESLRAELLGTGVSVTTICPGYVRTGLHEATRYHASPIERLLAAPPGMMRGLDPRDVARRAVDAGLAHKSVVPMGVERLGAALGRLAPRGYTRAASQVHAFLSRRRGADARRGVPD